MKSKYKDYKEIIETIKPEEQLTEKQKDAFNKLIDTRIDVVVKVSDVKPNPWNKNEMGLGYMEALDNALANPRIGQTLPILIMNNPNSNEEPYLIIDGYHRWMRCVHKGIDNIRAILFDDITIDEAKIITVMQNRIRGVTPDIGVHETLRDITFDNPHELLNIDPIEINKYEPPVIDTNITPQIEMTQGGVVSPEESEKISNHLDAISEEGKKELNNTLPKIQTLPLTLFPTQNEKEQIIKLADKIMETEEFKKWRTITGQPRREESILFACQIAVNIKRIDETLSKDNKRLDRLDQEKKDKEARKLERERIREQKKTEKKPKKK